MISQSSQYSGFLGPTPGAAVGSAGFKREGFSLQQVSSFLL
jgi:hypothetical protein